MRLLRGGERIFGRSGYQWTAAVAGFLGAAAVAMSALAVGPLPENRPQPWWFDLPGAWTSTDSGQVTMSWVFYIGMSVMVLCWLVVGFGVRAGWWRTRWLLLLSAVWVLPWLLSPVALTTDIYTYLGQGLVSNAGLDAYVSGPASVPLPDVLNHRIGAGVRSVPSPYGPIFLSVAKLVAPLAANHVVLAVVLLRGVELIGLVLTAISLPRVARAAGADPQIATWAGVASPLVLASGVLSGHNDLLMIGLLVSALAIANARGRYMVPLAIAVATLATLVKVPAAVGVVVIALAWALRAPRFRSGAGRIGICVVVFAAVVALVSFATGLGTQWMNLTAIQSPINISPPFTPLNAFAVAVHSLGVGNQMQDIGAVANPIAMLLAMLFAVLVLCRQRRLREHRAVGLILIAVVLASPTVWPWYLIWPVLLLAATRQGRGRFLWIAVAALALFVVRPDGSPQMFDLTTVWIFAVLGVIAFLGGMIYTVRKLILDPPPVIQH